MLFAMLDFGDYVTIFLIVLLLGGAGVVALRPAEQARLRRLERKLDMLLAHFGMEPPEVAALSAEAKQLADEGKKIEAIAVHREQTGLSLKDAKDAVEAYLNRPR